MATEPTVAETQPTVPKERALTEYSPETHALVEQNMPNASEQVKQETMALIEAIKRRAQAEVEGAGELARDTYLNAVRQAKEAIEQNQIFDKERIEKSAELLRLDAEKNWDSIVREVTILGDRLTVAAKMAWEALTRPNP